MRAAGVFFLLLSSVYAASPAAAAPLGLKEILDPFSKSFPDDNSRMKQRRDALDGYLKRGPEHAVLHLVAAMRGYEKSLDAVDANLDAAYRVYMAIERKFWGARDRGGIPPALMSEDIAKEKAYKHAGVLKFWERQFQDWTVRRATEILAGLDEPARKSVAVHLTSGMHDKDPYQALRCCTILAHLEGKAIQAMLLRAIADEDDPQRKAVFTRTLSVRSDCTGALVAALDDPSGFVRSAAARALADGPRSQAKAAVGALLARLPREKAGRVSDDLDTALFVLTGERGDWADWWKRNKGTWNPPPREDVQTELHYAMPPDLPLEGPVEFCGMKCRSGGVVLCVDASRSRNWPGVEQTVSKTIATLPEGIAFGLVGYGQTPKLFKKSAVKLDEGVRKAALAFLKRLPDKVDTPAAYANLCLGVQAALALAAGRKAKEPEIDTILLLAPTPQPRARIHDTSQIEQEVSATNRVFGVRVFAAGLSGGAQSFYLQRIAEQFWGRAR